MAAMASFFDVVQLEDSLFVSWKEMKKQGSLRYYMLSAFLAMVEIFRALHSLWVTLLPFALLWWNVMLHAMCAKYYSWNRSRLWLQAAGRRFPGDIMLETSAFSESSITAGEETCPSPHQTGSSADASHVTENREMSIVSLCRPGACAVAVHGKKKDVGSISHPQRKLTHGFTVAVDPFPHQSISHLLDRDGDVAVACLEESCRCHLIQFEEQIPCEAASHALKDQAVSSSSCHTSKLSSLSFLEERGPQVRQSSKDCHQATCSILLPHQVPPLAMLDVSRCSLISSEHSCLQINLDRDCDMLHFKGPVCIDHVSINWSMLREWLQIFNGSHVPGLNHGKKCPNLEWGFIEASMSQIRNDNYAILQLILSTTDGFNIFNIISSYSTVENVKLCIGEQLSLLDLPGFQMTNNIAYVDNGGSGLDSSEDIDSACCSSIKSDDKCDGAYCTSIEFTTDRDDGLQYSDVVYGTQCYKDDGCCCFNCCRDIEDSGIDSVEDTEDVHGSFVHPSMDKGDSFYDCSAQCNVGYDGPYCGMDVDDICSMDYDADVSDYTNFDSNVEISGAVCGDFHAAYEDGAYENPVEIHVNTWWDEDAVVVGEKETEEESIEEEWQVV